MGVMLVDCVVWSAVGPVSKVGGCGYFVVRFDIARRISRCFRWCH